MTTPTSLVSLTHILLLCPHSHLAAACCYVASHGCVLTCVHAMRCYDTVSLASLAVLGRLQYSDLSILAPSEEGTVSGD